MFFESNCEGCHMPGIKPALSYKHVHEPNSNWQF
jgi:hypothetical protein